MHPKIESSKLEILYDGYDYDVTELSKRHPGGDIILYYLQGKRGRCDTSYSAIS